MKFSINTKELNNTLKTASTTGAENIVVTAKADNTVVVVANGEVTSIKKTATVNAVDEEGTAVLNARFVTDIAKKAGSDEISFSSEENKLIQIKAGKSKFKLNTESSEPVHSSFDLTDASTFSLPASKLKEMLDRVSYAAASKESYRPILTGINISCSDGTLKAAATDSYRLAQDEMNVEGISDFNITIPLTAISSLQSTLLADCEEKDMLTISVSGSKAVFSKGETLLKTRLLDGTYPEVGRLIPSSFESSITVSRDAFQDVLERSMFLKSKEDGAAVIHLMFSEKGGIKVSSDSKEIGSFEEDLEGTTEYPDLFSIFFKSAYMIDALKHIRKETVTVRFTGELKPFVIEDDEVVHLMLPIRRY